MPVFTTMSTLLLFLLFTCVSLAECGIISITPQPSYEPSPALRPSPHLSFPITAHHSLTTMPKSSFHPLSVSSSSSSFSSRFSLLQVSLAESNLTGCGAIDFSGEVTIDSQGPYRLIVDTGSTTLAIVTNACTNCGTWPTYDPPASTAVSQQSIEAEYGSQTGWTGLAYAASAVTLGDSAAVSMTIAGIQQNQGFIDPSNVCSVTEGAPTGLNSSQGIMGFAYPSVAIAPTDSWISNYLASTGVSNEFSLQLCPEGGNVWIGGFDPAFMAGAFTYIPIIQQTYFTIMLTDIAVTSKGQSPQSLGFEQTTFGPCTSTSAPNDCAFVDSGTTLLLLPPLAYSGLKSVIHDDTYYDSIFGSNSNIPDPLVDTETCASANAQGMPDLATLQANLPTVSFTFTDADGLSNPTTLTINAIPGYLTVNYGTDGSSMYYCNGLGVSTAWAILGFSFMNQFTIRHDLTNQRLGFAPTAQCGVAAPPLLNFAWSTGDWDDCPVSCGGGLQWRQVQCEDQFGTAHADIACATYYSGTRPADSQSCNATACASLPAPATFTSVTANSAQLTPGQTYIISFSYTGAAPDYVTIFLSSADGSASLPSYIARNASTDTQQYSWTVPSTIAAGQYYLGGYSGAYGSEVYTSSSSTTVVACTSGACGADPCAAGDDVLCSGNGQCSAVNGSAVCSCAFGWNGTDCGQLLTGCIMGCVNGGQLSAGGCSCDCPTSFTGTLCQLRYANMSASFSLSAATVDYGGDLAIFEQTAVLDLAFAMGFAPSTIAVQSVASAAANHTVLLFAIVTQTDTTALVAGIDSLIAQLALSPSHSTALTSGLATAFLTSVTILSLPPADGSGSSGPQSAAAWLREWGPYLGCGIGGFLLLFCVLYLMWGGRCLCLRRKRQQPPHVPLRPKVDAVANGQYVDRQAPPVPVRP